MKNILRIFDRWLSLPPEATKELTMSHAVLRKGGKSPYRRDSFALFAFLAWILLTEVRADQASVEQKYPFDITETKLGAALLELCGQAQHQCLFPYELAQSEGVHPVIGNYTVTEALTIMLSGTNFSGGLTQRGIITVSPTQKST